MRSKSLLVRPLSLIPATALAAVAVAACSSGNNGSGTAGAATTTASGAAKKASSDRKSATVAAPPSRTYDVTMTGAAEVPRGAAGGSAQAVVALHGSTLQACWRFSQLKGFSHATYAHIHRGKARAGGYVVIPLSTGRTYLSNGCVRTTSTLIRAIEANPSGFYVDIHSKKYVVGAVRAQL